MFTLDSWDYSKILKGHLTNDTVTVNFIKGIAQYPFLAGGNDNHWHDVREQVNSWWKNHGDGRSYEVQRFEKRDYSEVYNLKWLGDLSQFTCQVNLPKNFLAKVNPLVSRMQIKERSAYELSNIIVQAVLDFDNALAKTWALDALEILQQGAWVMGIKGPEGEYGENLMVYYPDKGKDLMEKVMGGEGRSEGWATGSS